jgi:hypothetical protein
MVFRQDSLDGDVQVALRKLGKKDEVTRLKGLQELAKLAATGDDSGRILAALPQWTVAFGRLVFDPERRVREAAVSTQAAFVRALRKEVCVTHSAAVSCV